MYFFIQFIIFFLIVFISEKKLLIHVDGIVLNW